MGHPFIKQWLVFGPPCGATFVTKTPPGSGMSKDIQSGSGETKHEECTLHGIYFEIIYYQIDIIYKHNRYNNILLFDKFRYCISCLANIWHK